MSAQAMRAMRLASATATSMRGLRASHPGQPGVRRTAPRRPTDRRHRADDQEPPEIELHLVLQVLERLQRQVGEVSLSRTLGRAP